MSSIHVRACAAAGGPGRCTSSLSDTDVTRDSDRDDMPLPGRKMPLGSAVGVNGPVPIHMRPPLTESELRPGGRAAWTPGPGLGNQ